MNGTNDKENLVDLTAKEHFLCHMLLCKIYPDNYKLHYALWLMCGKSSKFNKRNYRISLNIYENIKKDMAKANSVLFSGENNGMFGRTKAPNK